VLVLGIGSGSFYRELRVLEICEVLSLISFETVGSISGSRQDVR
jgi:hypothetical protein